MKTITMNQKMFDDTFQATLDKLALIKFRESNTESVEAFHSRFHYQIHVLKERLENSTL